MDLSFAPFAGLTMVYTIGSAVLAMVVHIILAFAVYSDATKRQAGRERLDLIGAVMWGLVVFISGLAGAAVYWAIHYSTLRRIPVAASSPSSPPPVPGSPEWVLR